MGTTLAAGTPGLLVNGSIKTFDIAQMDSLVISIPDSSATHPELRLWAYGWKAGLPNPVDFHRTLRTRFNDSALLDVRSTSAWFRGFFDQEGSVGLRLAPDAQGTVRWTQGGSWIQEPQPIWRQAGWETSWLPEPANPGTAAYRNGNDRIGPKAPARDRHAGHAGQAGQAGQAV